MTNYQKIYERFKANMEWRKDFTEEQQKTVNIALVNVLWRIMGEEIFEETRKRNELGDIHLNLIESINFKRN